MGKDLKTVGFAAAVCLVCSLLLASVASGLKARQDRNRALDLKINVLKAFGVAMTDTRGKRTKTASEIEDLFASQVTGVVLDRNAKATDLKVSDLNREQLNERDKTAGGLKEYYPYYVFTDRQTGRKRYAIHVSGMGLWSIVKGYLALEDDLSTVAGIAFYDHAETPGLGGEIDKDAFQGQFKGKHLLKGGVAQYFRVLKPSDQTDAFSVHGISGATMTGKGITAFINSDFGVYNKHFETLRQGHGDG